MGFYQYLGLNLQRCKKLFVNQPAIICAKRLTLCQDCASIIANNKVDES
jgi:hypothetical protein